MTSSAPQIPIFLLGDPEIGKSTFLSRLHLGAQGVNAPYSSLPSLKDLDQPFRFDIRMYNRPYSFEFYDTGSPTDYRLLQPGLVILCFSIGEPESLQNVKQFWRPIVEKHFNLDESLPVILLGLCRDVRQREDYDGRVRRTGQDAEQETEEDEAVLNGRRFLYPQEGLRMAQEMRCDRYCECSALTGELCREVFEDIARTAALTTTENGAKTPSGCALM